MVLRLIVKIPNVQHDKAGGIRLRLSGPYQERHEHNQRRDAGEAGAEGPVSPAPEALAVGAPEALAIGPEYVHLSVPFLGFSRLSEAAS